MKRLLWLSLIGGVSLRGEELSIHNLDLKEAPWLTGPLLAPSGYTTPPGHFNVEPYLYFVANTGCYDAEWKSHSTPNFYSTYVQIQNKVGIVDGFDFQFSFFVYYNATEGKHYWNIGDMPIGFNVQLLKSYPEDPWPAMKLSLKANIPLGKYQHLNPAIKETDAIGAGSWLPSVAVVFSKLWNIVNIHYLEWRLSCTYQIGAGVHVKGFNSYGGSSETRGVVYPGNSLTVDGAIEYNFSQEWAVACDLVYTHINKNRFSGKGSAFMKTPSNEQWTLAPSVEYNWSENFGITAGPWFSFAGRNSLQFASGIVAVNIYF